MTIRSKLIASSAIMIGGIALVAALSIFAITSIRSGITSLTACSTPLQIRATELQKAIEGLSASLLQLGVAVDPAEVRRLSAEVERQKETIGRINDEIARLDAARGSKVDMELYKELHETVLKAVQDRLAGIALFKSETQRVDLALGQAEGSLAGIRREMEALSASGRGKVNGAVSSSSQLFAASNAIKDMMLQLREIQITLENLQLAKSQVEVLALKQKIKNINAAVQGASVDDPAVRGVKATSADIYDKFTRKGDGLIALKLELIGGKGSEARFAEVKRPILNVLSEQHLKLSNLVGSMESRVNRNRGDVEGAFRLQERISAITAAAANVSIDMKTLDSRVRMLMLSDTPAGYEKAAGEVRDVVARLQRGLAGVQREITLLQQPRLGRLVASAGGTIREAGAAVERIVTTQKSIIESNVRVLKTVNAVKETTLREVKTGEDRVKETAARQEGMVQDINRQVGQLATLILALSILVALVSVASSWFTIRRVGKSMKTMNLVLADIAEGEGDLTKRLDESARDEFGDAARLFNRFLLKLTGIIGEVARNSAQMAGATAHLATSARTIAGGAHELAGEAGSVATASEEMSAVSGSIAQSCQQASDRSRLASEVATSGAETVQETVRVMERIAQRVKGSADTVANLGSRSDQIGAIVTTINDIADQTNLLALNAAIEAARAGEAGLGFAVVADQVRSLAVRTGEATREIGSLIGTIQQETRQAVQAMEEGVREVVDGTERAARSGDALQEIQKQINEVFLQVNQIATAAEQQTATTSEITGKMIHMTDLVQRTASEAGDSAQAAVDLARFAEELKQLAQRFRLAA